MKATSTYVNCTNLTSAQIQAKIKTAQARLQTLEYIAGNKNYTKAHRYDAIIEAMVLEGQIVYLQFQLQQKLQRETSPAIKSRPVVSEVKVSNDPLRSRAKIHSDVNPNFHVRHRLMTEKEKELLQRNKDMYAFLDNWQ